MIVKANLSFGKALITSALLLIAVGCGQDRLSSLGPDKDPATSESFTNGPAGVRPLIISTDCVTLDLVGIGTGRPVSVTTQGYQFESLDVNKWLTVDTGSIILSAGGAVRISRTDGASFTLDHLVLEGLANDLGLNTDIRIEAPDAVDITDSFTGEKSLDLTTTERIDKTWYLITNTTDNGGIGSGPNLEISALNVCLTEEVINSAPIAEAGPAISLNCIGAGEVTGALDGSASIDPDGDDLTYAWSAPGITFDDAASTTPTAVFPHGTTMVTLTVTDENGASSSDQVVVTVEDTSPPTINMTVSPDVLKKGKKLVLVAAGISASDLCDDDVALSVIVTANESIKRGDTKVAYNNDGTVDVSVMAKRNKEGTGRIYTITATATNDSGLTTTSVGQVLVPLAKSRTISDGSTDSDSSGKKGKKGRR